MPYTREVGIKHDWAPDGRWIVYRVENLDRNSFRLFKMYPDGTHRTLIARLPSAPRGIDWGPRR